MAKIEVFVQLPTTAMSGDEQLQKMAVVGFARGMISNLTLVDAMEGIDLSQPTNLDRFTRATPESITAHLEIELGSLTLAIIEWLANPQSLRTIKGFEVKVIATDSMGEKALQTAGFRD